VAGHRHARRHHRPLPDGLHRVLRVLARADRVADDLRDLSVSDPRAGDRRVDRGQLGRELSREPHVPDHADAARIVGDVPDLRRDGRRDVRVRAAEGARDEGPDARGDRPILAVSVRFLVVLAALVLSALPVRAEPDENATSWMTPSDRTHPTLWGLLPTHRD